MTDNVFEDQRVSEVPEADSVDNTFPETASTDDYSDSTLDADAGLDADGGDFDSSAMGDDMDMDRGLGEEMKAEASEHLDRDGDGDYLEGEDIKAEGESFSDKFHDLKDSVLGDDERKL